MKLVKCLNRRKTFSTFLENIEFYGWVWIKMSKLMKILRWESLNLSFLQHFEKLLCLENEKFRQPTFQERIFCAFLSLIKFSPPHFLSSISFSQRKCSKFSPMNVHQKLNIFIFHLTDSLCSLKFHYLLAPVKEALNISTTLLLNFWWIFGALEF